MNLTDHRLHTKPWAGRNGVGNADKNTMSQYIIHSLRAITNVISGSHFVSGTEPRASCMLSKHSTT